MKVLHSANYPKFSEYRAPAVLHLHPYIKTKRKTIPGGERQILWGGEGANKKKDKFWGEKVQTRRQVLAKGLKNA